MVSAVGFKKVFPDSVLETKALILGLVCSALPDIDVLSEQFGMGVQEEYFFLAHRGITHSISFAIVWALILTVVFHRKESHQLVKWCFYSICTASHGLIDAMTTGGDGIGFFMPFTMEWYRFPFQFIEVSPIGIRKFFGEWGAQVLLSEMKYILIPVLVIYLMGILLNKYVYS